MEMVYAQSAKKSSLSYFVVKRRQRLADSLPYRKRTSPAHMQLVVVVFVVVVTLVFYNGKMDALRMINLDAPDAAFQGDTIKLSCFFSLQSTKNLGESSSSPEFNQNRLATDELLYAIKWYKNEREFFRYLAAEWPKKQALPLDGIAVDVERSDNHTVVLKSVSLKTSGLFRCEVSTDAPYFVTKSIERKMLIYSLPKEGPRVELLLPKSSKLVAKEFAFGERVDLICTAPESKPHASIDWIINNNLNLSAQPDLVSSSLFKRKEQRFVRLPSSILFNSDIAQPINKPSSSARFFLPTTTKVTKTSTTNSTTTSQEHTLTNLAANIYPTSKSPLSYTTYELLNHSTIQAVTHNVPTLNKPSSQSSGNGGGSLINLSPNLIGLVDQLTELSTSRLSFTVDANLLQLLATTSGSTSQASGVSAKDMDSVHHRADQAIKSHGIGLRQLGFSKRIGANKYSFQPDASNQNNSPPSNRVRPRDVSSNSAPGRELYSDNHEVKRVKRIERRHFSPIDTAPIHQLPSSLNSMTYEMKIRCASRVLQQLMYDEIRIKLMNTPLDNNNNIGRVDSKGTQRLENVIAKNSATCNMMCTSWTFSGILSNAFLSLIFTSLLTVP